MESSLQEGSLWGHPSEEQSQEPLTILSALISSKEQESVTFKDVAIDLTQEEWTLMDRSQRKMYIDVMLENITHLVSVGCQFFQSDVISQWEQGGVLWKEERGLAQGWSPGLENSHKKEETISMQDIFKEDPSNYNTIPPIRPMLVDTTKRTWTLDPLTSQLPGKKPTVRSMCPGGSPVKRPEVSVTPPRAEDRTGRGCQDMPGPCPHHHLDRQA